MNNNDRHMLTEAKSQNHFHEKQAEQGQVEGSSLNKNAGGFDIYQTITDRILRLWRPPRPLAPDFGMAPANGQAFR